MECWLTAGMNRRMEAAAVRPPAVDDARGGKERAASPTASDIPPNIASTMARAMG
jgi:hypothetical protein